MKRLIHFKFIILITILCFNCKFSRGQSLSIDETINYINDLSIKSNSEFQYFDCSCKHHHILSIIDEGLIKITVIKSLFNCKNTNNETYPVSEYSFYYTDIDINNIKIKKIGSIEYISIPCKQNAKNIKNHTFSHHGFGYNGDYSSKEEYSDEYTISDGSDYNKQKYLNAYKYLFSQILLSNKYKRIDDDPFSPNNYKPKINKSTISSNLTVPLTETGSVYSISINLGLSKYSFILDSGAGEMNISNEVEQQLVNEGIIKKTDYLVSGLYRLADGSIIICRRVMIKRIKIKNTIVTNVIASVGGHSTPLLLGRSFLNKFKKWTIDNNKSQLILER